MRNLFLVLPLIFLLASSCNQELVKAEYKATDNGVWERDEHIEFTFSELDSLSQYNVFINVRNDDTFPYNNLFLIAELRGPDGSVEKDTLEYQMANPDGTWLGQGYGSLKENKLWYKEDIVFSSSGVYTLKVAHAMRKNGNVNGVERLQGITDVGFEIEQGNKE